MKKVNCVFLLKRALIVLLLVLAFCFSGFSQNEKCLLYSHDMIQDIKGKIMSEYVAAEDANLYVIKVEVLPTYTIDIIKAACDSVPKNVKIVSDWKINYDKNYEKKVNVSGKNVLVTYYPNDKILYFEFPK